jgi:hypothetical protein
VKGHSGLCGFPRKGLHHRNETYEFADKSTFRRQSFQRGVDVRCGGRLFDWFVALMKLKVTAPIPNRRELLWKRPWNDWLLADAGEAGEGGGSPERMAVTRRYYSRFGRGDEYF